MDSLKLAFDTLIVGALALPWLGLFVYMFFKPSPSDGSDNLLALTASVPENPQAPIRISPFHGSSKALAGLLPESTQAAVASVFVVALGYFLGSAVTRISNDFFNDELWRVLPTEASIRLNTYQHEYCEVHEELETDTKLDIPRENGWPGRVSPFLCSPKVTVDTKKHLVTELFSFQEGRLLLAGEDKVARLKEFHDQILILRGSTLNGTALLVLGIFGFCASHRSRRWHAFGVASYVLAAAALVYGVVSLYFHLHHQGRAGYHDPPLSEFVLILFGICGFLTCQRKDEQDRRLYRNISVLALVLSLIAYGGWWWTEVMYDEQVIHSRLQPATSQNASGPDGSAG